MSWKDSRRKEAVEWSGGFGCLWAARGDVLLVNVNLAAADVGFEGAHASRIQRKPQPQLSLAKRCLGFL